MKRIILTVLFITSVVLMYAQGRLITGSVVDDANLPLPGVSVIVKGTTIGTVTDIDGLFSLNLSDVNENDVLVFSSIGFIQQEHRIGNNSKFCNSLTGRQEAT